MAVSVRAGESPTAKQIWVGGVTLVVSYETIVAFAVPGYGWCVSENVWSRTTGKHLNQECPGGIDRTSHEEFTTKLNAVLAVLDVDCNALTDTLRGIDLKLPDTTNRPEVEQWLSV